MLATTPQWLPVSFSANHYHVQQDLQWFGPMLSPTLLWTHCSPFFSPLLTKPSSHIGVLAILWLHKTFSRLRAFAVAEIIFLTFCWVFTHKLPFQKDFPGHLCNPLPWFIIFLKHLSVSSRAIYFNLFILLIIYIPQNLYWTGFFCPILYLECLHECFITVNIHCLLKKWITHNWFHQNEIINLLKAACWTVLFNRKCEGMISFKF